MNEDKVETPAVPAFDPALVLLFSDLAALGAEFLALFPAALALLGQRLLRILDGRSLLLKIGQLLRQFIALGDFRRRVGRQSLAGSPESMNAHPIQQHMRRQVSDSPVEDGLFVVRHGRFSEETGIHRNAKVCILLAPTRFNAKGRRDEGGARTIQFPSC